jgi:hypothetical protein
MDALNQITRVFGIGCKKYSARNWERGYRWGLSMAALCRHLAKFWQREDRDPETGLYHMAQVAWHALALLAFQLRGIGNDDRPVLTTETKRIYIAGPMRGHDQFNFPAFDRARDRWKAAGWQVVSPADLDREIGIDETTRHLPLNFIRGAMARDCAAVCNCQAIALLPGWRNSAGAMVEITLGHCIGIEFYDANTMIRLEKSDVY